jgi:heat shock protein HtpX
MRLTSKLGRDRIGAGDPVTRRVSLVARAVLALGLAIGFYVLAVAVACGILWLATDKSIFDSIISSSFIAAFGAIAILWAIVPRIDRFQPPGPRVTSTEEPALFELVATVAAATRQRMPDDVYFVNGVTASVAQRGGMLGLGSRRVLVLGLPLMQLLTIEELKAVIAHEFGHFHAGDVALGPLIYSTQAAIDRTLAPLSDRPMEMVFTWYTNWFTRVTRAVSRHQELVADSLAARVVGGVALAEALRKGRPGSSRSATT